MKKNLHFLQSLISVKEQNRLKNLLFVIFLFISAQLFSQNPALVKDILPPSYIQKIVTTPSGKTFFNTFDDNNHFSDLWGLWTTDGTQGGTVKLNLSDGHYTSTEATWLTPLGNNKIVFAGDNESGYGEVWVSDGTQAGTFGLENFQTAYIGGPVTNIFPLGDIVIYSVVSNGNTLTSHLQLRKTNGIIGDTSLVYDFGLYSDYSITSYKTIDNLGYIGLTNNVTTHSEIWRTDGTAAGTYQVKDLGQDYGLASTFMSFNNNIYFITISSTYGDYIWKSDGTNVGTAPLKQISTTFNQDNLYPYYAATNSELYFVANDGVSGKELWKTDGTVGGTGIAADVNTGSGSSNPSWLTALNDVVYFSATTPGTGIELWKFDINSGQGAVMVKDIFPGSTSSNPAWLSVQNNTLFFNAIRANNEGTELWMSDGSSANTLEVADLTPSTNGSTSPYLFSGNGNDVFFTGFTNNGDRAIYKYTAPQKIWVGSVSSDSQDGNNWFPAGTPAQSDNVLLPVNPTNSFSNPFLFCNDFINNGTTVDVGTGLALFTGNFFNSGTVTNNSGNGVFGITGNTTLNHTFGNSGTYNGQFTISSGVNLYLTTDVKLNDLRVEGGDSIFLGDYNFTVDGYSVFIPKIIANGSGSLFMPVGANPVTFPLSNPVTITNYGDYDYFGVNVKDGVYSNGTSGNIIINQAVNKTWNIEELTPGGSNATITLQWNATDELPGFDLNNVYLNHYTNGAWDSGTPGVVSGSDPYTFTRTGFTSFSPFSISSATGVLPINLISFSANKINSTVQLNWQVVSEKNVSFYTVERSNDGITFESLNQLKAFGTNYAYVDQQPLAGTDFYRLKMIDADGKFTYSKVVAIKMDSRNVRLQIFPNPARNILNIQVNGFNENAVLQIIDITGRKVKEEKISLNGTTSVSVDINNLSKGTYNLLLKGNSINEQKKFVKE